MFDLDESQLLMVFALGAGATLVFYLYGRSSTGNRFVEAAKSYLGTLYAWGGAHEGGPTWGLDCSGLVLASLKKANLQSIAPVTTSDSMYRLLPPATRPKKGDLALYGTEGHVHHVAILVSENSQGGWSVISAEGEPIDTTPEIARARGDMVRIRDDHRFMKDFLAFREILP